MDKDELFLILRKPQKWNDISPIFYLGDDNPNKHLIKIGARVIIEKELGSEIKFIGYAEIDSIEKNLHPYYSKLNQSIVYFKNYVKFFPPRQKSKEIRRLLHSLPNYRWYDSVRRITKYAYYEIINFCLEENWSLYLEEYSSLNQSVNIEQILTEEESEWLEFKSSMLFPVEPTDSIIQLEKQLKNAKDNKNQILQNLEKEKKKQKENMKHEIAKTIAAFLNSRGGVLIIGVDNDKNIIGLENDFMLLKDKQNWDGWVQIFKQILIDNYKMDPEIIPQIRLIHISKENKTIVKLEIPASDRPIFIGENDDFYIRLFNSSEKLSHKQYTAYLKRRWKNI